MRNDIVTEPKLIEFQVCPWMDEPGLKLPDLSAEMSAQFVLGWRTAADPVDGGPTRETAEMVARALCVQFTCLFVAVDEHAPGSVTRDWTQTPGGWARLWTSRQVLIASRDPNLVRSAFESWANESQMILLRTEASLPVIDEGKYKAFLRSKFDTRLLAEAISFDALVLPGVDGDLAGFYATERCVWEEFLSSLQAVSEAAGISVRTVSPEELGFGLGSER
jgi:hypothetical protein